MINEADYDEHGLACADVCSALDRGMDGRRVNELNQSVLGAIGHLTTLVEQAMHTLGDSLTKLLIVGPWLRYMRTLSKNVTGCSSLGCSMRRMIKRRLPPGG